MALSICKVTTREGQRRERNTMVTTPKLENLNNSSGLNSKPPVDEDVIS
ncbi:hypothetical protein CASFOL_008022 [Castilleja foliolosa]|uniref:Uncharacterized protein n=1 Tax=Castilleja foliolosa TaxID=1961234 RepID=A0ABD3DYT3_9LAMI